METANTLSFSDDQAAATLAGMNPEEFNSLAFGAIELDEKGTILRYNEAEGAITGRDPKEVIGKNFFMEVAPCTDSPEFRGRFRDGVNSGDLNITFEYLFTFQMRPTKVSVRMKQSLTGDSYWVFVKRLQKKT